MTDLTLSLDDHSSFIVHHSSFLDPHLTFETFTVGSANRLAHKAALRVADAPGEAYNPLVVYGASGLGKTHLLMAIGHRALQREPSLILRYASVESLFEDASGDGASGRPFGELRHLQLLLLDDLQRIGGRADAQAGLAAVWDAIVAAGGQIVLASDRPARDIAGLEAALGSRFARGLVVDIAPPEHEARLRIVQARVAEEKQSLADGVADALARLAFGSVRELYAGLNRVLAAQELEGRLLRASEVPELLGIEAASARHGEFGAFLREVSGAVGEVLRRRSPVQRLAEAIMHWEADGFRTARLEAGLMGGLSADQVDEVIASFESDVARLRVATDAIRALDATAPELARADVLLDPDRVDAAEWLVRRVRDRLEHTPDGEARHDATGHDGAGAQAPAEAAPSYADGSVGGTLDGGDGGVVAAKAMPVPEVGVVDRWFLSPEKVVWRWPYIEDAIVLPDER